MLAILAAGQSHRFGSQDKLTALLGGKMLGLHVSDSLHARSFLGAYIVVPERDHPCAARWRESGYDILVNEEADQGQSTSVRLAAIQAQSVNADGLCICLADTPFVAQSHIEQLTSEFHQLQQKQIVAASNGEHAMPPAIFPPGLLKALTVLDGDKGARSLLLDAKTVGFPTSDMLDIDTPHDLVLAQELL